MAQTITLDDKEYEIEKLSDGKLTKYKLNQAIENNQLKAEKLEGGKKGRGVPKYLVREDELQEYIKFLEINKKSKLVIPDETEASPENSDELNKDTDDLIRDQRLFLEQVSERMQAIKDELVKGDSIDHKVEKQRSEERRQLLLELSNAGLFSIKKKKEIISKLFKLA